MIYGLPGQTPATWMHTLNQVTKQNILPVIFLNEPLPASPATYNPEYQQKFQYEYINSVRIQRGVYYNSKIPKKCKSFSQHDLVQMNVMSGVYTALSVINFVLQQNHIPLANTADIVDDFLRSDNYQMLHNNLYCNWTENNNFYYTLNFSGQPEQIADPAMGWSHIRNNSFLRYISTFFLAQERREFSQLAGKGKFQKIAEEISGDID